MEPLERIPYLQPEDIYKKLTKFEQFLVDAFSVLAGIFTLGFKYNSAFRWAVSKFDHSEPSPISESTNKTHQTAMKEISRAALAEKLGVGESDLREKRLNLTNKLLTTLPSEIGHLTHLEVLQLGCKRLANLPSEIGKLTQLVRLDLNNNNISNLPNEIGDLTRLDELNLSSNPITQLPDSIGNLTDLQHLNLSFTQLQTLPNTFCNLAFLNSLALNGARNLRQLPENFGNLRRLRRLRLEHTSIESLPTSFGNLNNLNALELSNTPLTSLPESFGNLTHLQRLIINDARLNSLPNNFANLQSLTALQLLNNRFTECPEVLHQLPSYCTVEISLPPRAAQELRLRASDSRYQGPRFRISIQDNLPEPSTHKTADQVIREWGGDPAKLSDKENLKTWLQRQKDTKDYKDQPERVKNEIKDLLVWMGEISDPDIKEQAKLLISQGSATCGDRLTQSRNDIACVKKVAESGNLNINDLKDLVIGLHRLDLVRKAARTKLETINASDDIETLLHFENALKAPLNLPISTTGMLYQGMSGVTPQDLENTKTAILSQTTSLEDQAQILIKNVVWKKRLDAHPEMPAIKEAIAKSKEDFGERVSGKEAQYEKEFKRLEKEEWDPYLILTRKILNNPS